MSRTSKAVEDIDAALAAAQAAFDAAAQSTFERRADVTAGERALEIVREKAGVFAKAPLAPGDKLDPAERRRHATVVAVAEYELAIEQRALDEALVAERAAAIEVGRARLLVLARDAALLRRPEGEATIAVQDKIDELVVSIEAAQAAHHARLAADGEVRALRDELQGREPSRSYDHDHDGSLRRFLSGLPMKHQMILHIEWPTHVDLRELGESYISRAA